MTQKVYGEDEVLAALQTLDGQAMVSRIAAEAELDETRVLVACGQMNGTKLIKVDDKSRKGNPCFRIREEKDQW